MEEFRGLFFFLGKTEDVIGDILFCSKISEKIFSRKYFVGNYNLFPSVNSSFFSFHSCQHLLLLFFISSIFSLVLFLVYDPDLIGQMIHSTQSFCIFSHPFSRSNIFDVMLLLFTLLISSPLSSTFLISTCSLVLFLATTPITSGRWFILRKSPACSTSPRPQKLICQLPERLEMWILWRSRLTLDLFMER